MKKRTLTVAACLLAAAFWFFDSSVHYFVFDEPNFEVIPGDFTELWMRIVIVTLISLFGIFGDHFSNSIYHREKQLEVARVYNGMIHASLQVLVNLLDQMELFKLEAYKCKDFDREVIKLYDDAIDEASNLVDTLSKIHEATENTIGPPLDPRLFARPPGKADPAENPDNSVR